MWFIANWKILVTAAGTLAICLILHKLDIARIEAKHLNDIAAVKKSMTDECTKAQAITSKVSHDYQIELGSLNSRLSAAQRLRDNRCIAVTLNTPAGHDAAAAGKELLGRNVGADRLIDLAGRCEKVRIQLKSCQQFIRLENGAAEGH